MASAETGRGLIFKEGKDGSEILPPPLDPSKPDQVYDSDPPFYALKREGGR